MTLGLNEVTLSINIGVLAAIVYTLRIIILVDKKLSKIMEHQGISEKTE